MMTSSSPHNKLHMLAALPFVLTFDKLWLRFHHWRAPHPGMSNTNFVRVFETISVEEWANKDKDQDKSQGRNMTHLVKTKCSCLFIFLWYVQSRVCSLLWEFARDQLDNVPQGSDFVGLFHSDVNGPLRLQIPFDLVHDLVHFEDIHLEIFNQMRVQGQSIRLIFIGHGSGTLKQVVDGAEDKVLDNGVY